MNEASSEPCCTECGTPKSQVFRQSLIRGRCKNCYQRHVYAQKKAGTFEAIEPAPPLERLFSRGVPGRNGCIIWTGCTSSVTGYGQFSMKERPEAGGYAHRAAYLLVKGEIPEGHVIDHACHNRDPECTGGTFCIHHRCINPHHLDAVTQSENHTRSPHTQANARPKKTHCARGHEFSPENTRLLRDGRRACIACHRKANREYEARRRARQKTA